MNAQKRIGIILIVLGGLILLDQLQLFHLSGKNLIALLSVILGLLLIKKSQNRPKKRGLLAGSFFLIWGGLFLVFDYHTSPMGRTLFFGHFFLSLGLANLIYFFFSGVTKSLYLFAFVLFEAIGATMVAAYYGKLDVLRLQSIVDTYWPVVLILFGIFILVDSYRSREGGEDADSFHDQPEKEIEQ